MSNYHRYTPEQQAKIDHLEIICNNWEDEESECASKIGDLTHRLAVVTRRRDKAEDTLIAFIRECNATLTENNQTKGEPK